MKKPTDKKKPPLKTVALSTGDKKTAQAKSLMPPNPGIHFTQLKHKAAVKGKEKKELKEILKHENASHKGELEKMRSGDTGQHDLSKNKTAVITEGIATRPEISGSAIEKKIAKLYHNERKNGDKGPLENFLAQLIQHISPAHSTKDDVPGKANYIAQVKTKHSKALGILQKMEHLHAGEPMREKFAFKIAIYVSRSPVNLLPGDIAPKLDAPKPKAMHPATHTAHQAKAKTSSKAGKPGGGKMRAASRGK